MSRLFNSITTRDARPNSAAKPPRPSDRPARFPTASGEGATTDAYNERQFRDVEQQFHDASFVEKLADLLKNRQTQLFIDHMSRCPYWSEEVTQQACWDLYDQYDDMVEFNNIELAETLLSIASGSNWIICADVNAKIEAYSLPFDISYHRPDCVHGLGAAVTARTSRGNDGHSIATQRANPFAEQSHAKVSLDHILGLAGCLPQSFNASHNFPNVRFTKSTATIMYGLETVALAENAAFSAQPFSARTAMHNVLDSFERIQMATVWLQTKKLACDSFTILVQGEEGDEIDPGRQLKLTRISFKQLARLYDALEISRGYSMAYTLRKDLLDDAAKVAIALLENIGLQPQREWFGVRTSDLESLHIISVATQVIALGLQLYSQSHFCPLQSDVLVHLIKEVYVYGINPFTDDPCVVIEMSKLSCLDAMAPNGLMSFRQNNGSTYGFSWDVEARTIDLLDTWDNSHPILRVPERSRDLVEFTLEQSEILAIEMGGGFIKVYEPPLPPPQLRPDGIIGAHWTPGAAKVPKSKRGQESIKAFKWDSILRIGTITALNDDCRHRDVDHWKLASKSPVFKYLGTSPPQWELNERQLMMQAGQYVQVSFSGTWKLKPAMSLKDHYLSGPSHTIDLSFFTSTWGLLVSPCTKIAQRVPICRLLAEALPIYAENTFRSALVAKYDMIRRFNNDEVDDYFCLLSDDSDIQANVMGLLYDFINIIGKTGIDKGQQCLRLAWFYPKRPNVSVLIPLNSQNAGWLYLLEDTDDCATFAAISSQCLHFDSRTCPAALDPSWTTPLQLIDTQIALRKQDSIFKPQKETDFLANDNVYSFGSPGQNLRAKFDSCSVPTLFVYQLRLPNIVSRRLNMIRRYKKVSFTVRERRFLEEDATSVLLMARAELS